LTNAFDESITNVLVPSKWIKCRSCWCCKW